MKRASVDGQQPPADKLRLAAALPPPARPEPGQRWRRQWRLFDVVKVCVGAAVLLDLDSRTRRAVRWERLTLAYEYLGDWSVPAGYQIQRAHLVGGWVWVDPHGHAEGCQTGGAWTWQQARDAAVADAAARARRRRSTRGLPRRGG